ncbi:type II toxin-antitoxin system RelE/ParE family toxin [Bacteroidetes/Chlorobi group bacterium ChocPot_Mid]|nr:MAG: type II toxin-antitoxin system RelE/ParE family toxin [Bacteroidetes/Chlorobi group bacterium ChocPot_Mid]
MKLNYKIIFHPEAKKELEDLDGSVRIKVLKQIKKLKEKPELGDGLGNKAGIDLSGYRKMYADNKRVRIVYKILEEIIVVYIISIARREDMLVYVKAKSRIPK